MITKTILSIVLAAASLSSLVACSSDDDKDTNATGGAQVAVTLSEYAVTLAPAVTDAGSVKFNIANDGAELHEFVVVKSDLDPADLPVSADGSFDEEGTGVEAIDEVEDIPGGGTGELDVTLDPGHYYLVCNIVEATGDSHFHAGMYAAFTVE